MESVRLLEGLRDKGGDMKDHLLTIYSVARGVQAKTIVEIGVRHGMSTMALLAAAQDIGGKVFSVDIDFCKTAHSRARLFELEDYWKFFRMPSRDFIAGWTDGPIYLAFIDGDHRLGGVWEDFSGLYPHVKQDGLILLHDTFCTPEVSKREGIDVAAFVTELFNSLTYCTESVTLPYCNGLTIIRKLDAYQGLP